MKLHILLLGLVLLTGSSVFAQEEAAPEAAAEAAPVEEAAPAAEGEAAPAAEGEAAPAAEGDAAAPEGADTKADESGCKPCPVVTIQHYEAKGCKPVMNETIDKCCPSSYDCKSEEARGIPLTSCHYKGVTYELGQEVPVDGPCRRGCLCKESLDPTEPAKIECGIVECPSLFSAPKPGCRALYSVDECCETELECNVIVPESEVVNDTATTIREADCFAEGLEYFIGDKVLFSQSPCQYCVCSDQFSGADGPGCTKVDCGMEYRNRAYLREGCTPLYLSGSCCNIDWICPGSPQIILDADLKATGEEDPKEVCTFGDMAVPLGEAVTSYDCHINCACTTPPELTCTQYATCEMALEAKKAGFAP